MNSLGMTTNIRKFGTAFDMPLSSYSVVFSDFHVDWPFCPLSCCSKSEYVRCLRFSCQDSLYVATNHGYLYLAKLCDTGGAQWNQLVQVSNGAPIICMDLLSKDSFELDCGAEDWIAIGDGKGNMTVIGVSNDDCTPTVRLCFTWPAEMERQLLGTYWCKSLGCR